MAGPIRYRRPTMTNDSVALIGTWLLVRARAFQGDIRDDKPYGSSPRGLLIYAADGYVAAMISHGNRSRLSADRVSSSMEERADAFATSFSYAGRYTVDDGQVVHHVDVASVENWVGTDLVRSLTWEGADLVLRTPELLVGGLPRVTELVWRRAEMR